MGRSSQVLGLMQGSGTFYAAWKLPRQVAISKRGEATALTELVDLLFLFLMRLRAKQ
jgi:hypothetical protein